MLDELLLKTSDGGDSWSEVYNLAATVNHINFVTPDIGYVVGGFADLAAYVYKTIDGGVTWQSQIPNATYELYASFFLTPGLGYAVGNLGVIIKTTDGGANWVSQTSGTDDALTSVGFTSADTGIAVGYDGLVVITYDGGTTWTQQPSSNSHLQSKTAAGYREYAVGLNGVILSSANLGECWATEVSGSSEDLVGLFFANDSLGFAVGDNGEILRTTFNLPNGLGCTDPNFAEYDPSATIDDGSCLTPINYACPGLTAYFTQSADTLNINNSGYVEFSNVSTTVNSWNWDFGNGSSAIAANTTSVIYTSMGTFTVSLMVENNSCADTFYSTVVVNDTYIGTGEESSRGKLQVYPNPNVGMFTVSVPSDLAAKATLQIFHVDGRLVYSNEIRNTSGEFKKVVDLSEQSKGIYYIRLTDANRVYVEKVIYQ